MDFIEIGMMISIGLLSYFYLFMKFYIYKKGFGIIWFPKWGGEYRLFKSLIDAEENEELKRKLIGTIWGLKLSAALLVAVTVGGVLYTKFKLWGLI